MVKGAPRRKGAPAAGAASASAPPLTSAAQATTYSPAPPSPSPSSDSSSGLDDDRPPAGGGASARSGSVEAAELDEDYDAQAEAITCQCQWGDCQDTFTDLTTLIDHITEKHVGSHKSTYTCEWTTCPRRGLSQTSRFALISHMRTHTGEKPFICILPECPKSFTRSDALAKHMRLQHNIEPPAPGRGGSRKRKRGMAGVDEALTLGHSASSSSTPLHHASTTNSTTGGQATAGAGAASSSTTVSQPPSSIPNATGFNTFKLDRSATRRGAAAAAAAAAAAGASSSNGVGAEANGVSMVGGLTESKRGANGRPRRGKAGEAAMQIPVTVLEVQRLPRGASGAGATAGNGVGGMENGFGGEGVEEVTLDDLPVYLQKEYDEKTGLIHGRSVYQVLYLLMKARYRWALEQNEALSEELKEARIEAKKEKDEKETVLDEFLRRSLGDDATELTTLPPPPPSVAAALQAQQEQLQLQQQISQDASTTAPSIEMSYSAMNGVSAGAPVQHNGSVAFRV